jgi:anti-sigma regulatory factor (Ser/Thr protein kinase)
MQPSTRGSQLFEQAAFTPEPHSARAARRFVAERLAKHRIRDDLAVLLVSELATNAVLHARTEFVVRTAIADERLRVEVEDYNSRPPLVAHTPAEATSGRGLHLLHSLADAWGVEGCPDGKIVWFEVPATVDRDHAFA